MSRRSQSKFRLFLAGLLLAASGSCSSQAADGNAPPRQPATVSDAAQVLDLGTLALFSGAKPPQRRLVAGLEYVAPSDVKTAFEFHRKQLVDAQWAELPGAYVSPQMASAMFGNAGFTLSLTVSPGQDTNTASVRIKNLGNVDLAKLPVPPEAKPQYAGPANAIFVSEIAVEPTREACRKLLMERGWEPYGTAGDSLIFKQNAVRLNAFIRAAPAQGGKTMITYSTDLMSADLPAPAETENLQYADNTTRLLFDTRSSMPEIEAFYRSTLAKAGWEATTEKPFKLEFKDHLIFREPQKNLLELEMYAVEGKNRVALAFQSAAEVAELDRMAKAEMARRKAEAEKQKAELNKPQSPNPKLAISLPPEAKIVEQTASRIKFQVPNGKAKASVDSWQKQFLQDGWKVDASSLEDVAGAVSFSKGRQSLTVNYTDTGLIPADITLDSIGVDLERAGGKK